MSYWSRALCSCQCDISKRTWRLIVPLVEDLPVVGQIKVLGKLFEASLVIFECSHEEARGFGGIASPPFLPRLFMVDAHCFLCQLLISLSVLGRVRVRIVVRKI